MEFQWEILKITNSFGLLIRTYADVVALWSGTSQRFSRIQFKVFLMMTLLMITRRKAWTNGLLVDIQDGVGVILQRKLSGIWSGLFVYMVSAAVFPFTGAGWKSCCHMAHKAWDPSLSRNQSATHQTREVISAWNWTAGHSAGRVILSPPIQPTWAQVFWPENILSPWRTLNFLS